MRDDAALRGLPVAVLGLGIEGRDLVRFLRTIGAEVTVFDTRPREAVAAAAAEAERLGATVVLGPHDPAQAERFRAVYVSQSVLLHREPFVRRARELGLPLSSMVREFMRRWPGRIVAVTGSSGKTTTTSLLAATFAAAGVPHIVGGNIGLGLLGQLDQGMPATWAVLEVSHTQLQLVERGPDVAAVTNVTPNHLDQFTWEQYVDLKRTLVRQQCAAGIAVLNATDPVSRAFAADTAAAITWFNANVPGEPSAYVEDEHVMLRLNKAAERVLPLAQIPLRGQHNVENVLCAAATAAVVGIPLPVIAASVRAFQPVAHRLETVATVGGVTWVNDSIATSPERTLAGIRSFEEPLVLLLGGREKKLPLKELAALAHRRARSIVCFGEAGPLLAEQLATHAPVGEPRAEIVLTGTLPEAVSAAVQRAQPGDVVLLSPACTSFDAYPNFERRGEEFRALVAALAQPAARKDGAPLRP
ncbi:MAG TPA: UDP-N-acetylmuramoyl-L-alanine--D-glutamate ligase [Dehalococcoidia bacterium]|nr:UDP-N-acetylmuramoyl-L-alanine--D-glutamate ligase [Dehalococcoidia bacterium]